MRTATAVDALVTKYGSINAASRMADIPLSTLFKLRREHVDVRVSTLACVARALELSLPRLVQMLVEGDNGLDERGVASGGDRGFAPLESD